MKGILCCLFVCVIISFAFMSAYGVEMDGIIGAKEWRDAVSFSLIDRNEESNSDVGETAVFYTVNEKERSIYFGIKYRCENMQTENAATAVELSFDGTYCATLYGNGEADVNYGLFDAEAVFSYNGKLSENYCEIRIGFKYGVPRETTVGIRIFDHGGRPSNYYEFMIMSEAETESVPVTETTETATQNKTTVTETSTQQHTDAVITAASAVTSAASQQTTEKEDKPMAVMVPSAKDVTDEKKKESEKTDRKETSASKTVIYSESEAYVKRYGNTDGIGKGIRNKSVGFSLATAVAVSAVFIGVMTSVLKPKKQNFFDNDKDKR